MVLSVLDIGKLYKSSGLLTNKSIDPIKIKKMVNDLFALYSETRTKKLNIYHNMEDLE